MEGSGSDGDTFQMDIEFTHKEFLVLSMVAVQANITVSEVVKILALRYLKYEAPKVLEYFSVLEAVLEARPVSKQ